MRALAAFVLAAGLLLGAYLHAYESALMDATRAVAQVGQSSAVRLSDLLSRADALSRNIASQTAGVQNSLATSATLIEMGRLIPQAHAVLLLSGTGKLLGSSQFLVHTEERPGDQAWFKAARTAAAGTISLAHVTGAGARLNSDQIVLASRLLSRAGQPDRVVAIVFGRDAFRRLVVPDWAPQRVSVTVVAATGDVLFASANVASAGSAGLTAAAAAPPPEQGAIEPAAPPGTPSRPADRLNPLRFLSGPISTTVPLPRDGLQVQASFGGTLPLQGDALGLLQWNLWLGIGLFALAAVAALGSASQRPGSGTQQLEVLRDRVRTSGDGRGCPADAARGNRARSPGSGPGARKCGARRANANDKYSGADIAASGLRSTGRSSPLGGDDRGQLRDTVGNAGRPLGNRPR